MFGLLKTLLFTAALRQGAGNAKRSLQRAAICVAAGVIAILFVLAGLAFLIAAAHEALAYATDTRTANLISGGVLILVGIVIILVARGAPAPKALPRSTLGARNGLADLPGVGDLTGLPPGLLGPEVERLLARNVGPLAIGAFVAGLLLSARRR